MIYGTGESGIILVGEAPSKRMFMNEEEGALAVPRLADLCGVSLRSFLELYDRTNLFDEWPGRAEKGDEFPYATARAKAWGLGEDVKKKKIDYHTAVLMGRRVFKSFLRPMGKKDVGWFEDVGFSLSPIIASHHVFVVPHPSGISSYWDDDGNVEKARRFWTKRTEECIVRLADVRLPIEIKGKGPLMSTARAQRWSSKTSLAEKIKILNERARS